MNEEENKSVEQEAQAVAHATESEITQEATGTDSSSPNKKSDAEYNWAELRRIREEDRRRLQELDQQKRELEEKVNGLLKQKEVIPEEDYGIKDDDIAEGKHVKELKKELKELRSYIKQKEVSTVDERLSLKFSDFADVVTKENIELLKQNEPELAISLSHNPDPYAQGVAAYKLLKKLGIGPQGNSVEKEKAKANLQKPVSVNAVTKQSSALGNAHLFENGLTKELKSQLFREMQECAKRS